MNPIRIQLLSSFIFTKILMQDGNRICFSKSPKIYWKFSDVKIIALIFLLDPTLSRIYSLNRKSIFISKQLYKFISFKKKCFFNPESKIIDKLYIFISYITNYSLRLKISINRFFSQNINMINILSTTYCNN